MGFVAPVLMAVGVGAGTAGTIGTIASAAMSIFSMVSSISGGMAQRSQAAQQLEMQQRQLELQRSTTELQAAQQANERTKAYRNVISSQTAIWAARGVQLDSGVVVAAQDAAYDTLKGDLNTIDINRVNRLASLSLQGWDAQMQSRQMASAGTTRMLSGIGTSLFQLGGTITKGFPNLFSSVGASAGAAGGAGAAAAQGAALLNGGIY